MPPVPRQALWVLFASMVHLSCNLLLSIALAVYYCCCLLLLLSVEQGFLY